MSFKALVAKKTGLVPDGRPVHGLSRNPKRLVRVLNEGVDGEAYDGITQEDYIVPDENTLYQRGLQQDMARIGANVNKLTKWYQVYRKNTTTEQERDEAAADLAELTDAVFTELHDNGLSLGSSFQTNLETWFNIRGHHLSDEHEAAVSFYEANGVAENTTHHVVYRFEDLSNELSKHHFTKRYSIDQLRDDLRYLRRITDEDPSKITNRADSLFPTEIETRQQLYNRVLSDIDRDPSLPSGSRIERLHSDGDLRITSENHTLYTDDEDGPKTISRVKQGRNGDVSSEAYKAFATMIYEEGDAERYRDDYSYDSVALWHTNMASSDLIRTLLHYFHDPKTVNARNGSTEKQDSESENKWYEEAKEGQSGFSLKSDSGCPGDPEDFHKHLASQVDEDSPFYDLLKQPVHTKAAPAKTSFMNNWLWGETPSTTERAVRQYFDATLKDISGALDTHIAYLAEQDERLARHGQTADIDFMDILPGWKGVVKRCHKNMSGHKNGHSVLPFELLVTPVEAPYRHGVGSLSGVTDDSLPGVGIGDHTRYKQQKGNMADKLEEDGLLTAYKVFESYYPSIFVD